MSEKCHRNETGLSELTGKVELNMLEVILSHLKHISAIGKEDIATFTVFCHILEFTLLEGFQLLGVIDLYPTSLIQTDRLPTTLRIVFVF